MTDLEKLWNDLPTSEPPVTAILEAARARRLARRRRVVRPLVATGGVAALLATFVAGAHLGGGSVTGTPPGGDVSPVAFQADLDPATGCDELLASYRERGADQVTAWGWAAPGVLDRQLTNLAGTPRRLQAATGYRAKSLEQTSSATGTNVQETDVDEPDTVKTDGSRVVRVRGSELVVYDASGATMRRVSSIHVPRIEDAEILLDDDVVVVIGADLGTPRDDLTGQRRGSRVVTVSLDDVVHPAVTSDVTYSSRVLSARQHGSVVRLVLAAGLPALDFTRPKGRSLSTESALSANRALVASTKITDWLPTYDAGDGVERLLDCTDVAVPRDVLGLDTVSVVGIDTAEPTAPHAIGLAASTTIAYESADHLYLASSPVPGCPCRFIAGSAARTDSASADGTSRLFQFDLDGVSASHVASGEVEGTIADRWSLDESDGVLRVAVGPSSETGRFNSLVTLRRSGTSLAEIGRVDHLGPGEDIKSVRWTGDLAIIVTYREVDPLYTVDLTDPAAPRLLGELKIPGFSAYLHPLGNGDLLGVGYSDRGRGAQIALFDVSDLRAVHRDDVVTYPGRDPLAAADPRAFTWLSDRDTALMVIRHRDTVSVATIRVDGGHLVSSQQQVEYGSDAEAVRTLELADGRVALVTGEDVDFFDVP